MVFPCYYNAPVSYYSLLIQNKDGIVIELFDNYTKQTFRNRCRILGANGTIDLVIPVVKKHREKMIAEEVKKIFFRGHTFE